MLNTTLIRTVMQQLGLSQSALADLCKVSKEAVSNWLSGESVPRPNKARALADVLKVSIESLFSGSDSVTEPVVAYRTHRNRAVTGNAKEAADDIARHLRELVPFVQRETLFAPPVLEAPELNDAYIREAVRQVRARVGLAPTDPLTRARLLELHREFGSFLVPVFWGRDKSGHENALSVLLPDSRTSWVVFSLSAKNDDFNYWLAHELGHCYSLHVLQGDDGEQFAERFAQELLFPLEAATQALEGIESTSLLMEHANWYAGKYDLSVVTVIKQLDRAAQGAGHPKTGLDNVAFWRAWNKNRKNVPTVSEALFGSSELSTEEYVLRSEEVFDTPFFRALAQWQVQEGGRSPAFISAVLNIELGSALELSHFLMKLHGQLGAVGGSPKSRS